MVKPLDIWGVGGNWAQGMSTANRLTALTMAQEMGCTWIRDAASWLDMTDATKLAKTVECKAQCDSLGLRYYLALVMNAPDSVAGGGGEGYPTDENDWYSYLASFLSFYVDFCDTVAPYAIALSAETFGPQHWLPDNDVTKKTLANTASSYWALWKATKAVTPAGIMLVATHGDGDIGYLSGGLTALKALGFTAPAVAPYDYRLSMAAPHEDPPYHWGYPENDDVGDVYGAVNENIAHYQALMRTPVIISETGWHIGGTRQDGLAVIDETSQASLLCRSVVLATMAMPMAFCIHTIVDGPGTTAGILNDDYTARTAYTVLKALLGDLQRGCKTSLALNGTTYTALTGHGTAQWDIATDAFTYTDLYGNVLVNI